MAISFSCEDIKFQYRNKLSLKKDLKRIAENEEKRIGDISIVFCSNSYILDVNRKFLNHDYFTDIITFDYCDGNVLNGDLIISVDTVNENAEKYKVEFLNELHRVIIHGIMHLVGYGDKTRTESKIMKSKEDFYLAWIS